MPQLPFAVRVPGAARALHYCATAATAEQRLLDGLKNGLSALVVEYHLRPVLTVTQAEYKAWMAQHGQWRDVLNNGRGGYHVSPEQGMRKRITDGVDALGPDPVPGLRGSRRRALATDLVARGLSPEAAEQVARAHL